MYLSVIMFSGLAREVIIATDTRLRIDVSSTNNAALSEYSATKGAEQESSLATVKVTAKAVPCSNTGNSSVTAVKMYA